MGGISRWHADVSVLAVSVFANCQGLRIEGSGKCIKKFWTNCEHQEMQIGHDTYRVSLCWLFWTLEVWKLPESPAAKNSYWKLRSAPRSKSISNRLRLTPNNSFCYRCPQTFFLLWRDRDLRWKAYSEMRVARHYLTYDQCTESCNVIAFAIKSFFLDAFRVSRVANIQSSRRSSHVIEPHLCRRLFAMQLCEQLRWAERCFLHDVNSSP